MKFSEYQKKNPIKSKENDWTDDYDFAVCHLISEARLYTGLTQQELARRMKTQQPSVARVENGSALPGHDFLKRMALAIGVPLIAPKFGFTESIRRSDLLGSPSSSQKLTLKDIISESTFSEKIDTHADGSFISRNSKSSISA